MNDAGKISFLPKGEYDSGAMYEALDVVKYDGMVWVAKKSSKGITPVEGENWMCLLTAADYATADAPGIVKPDGDTIEVSTDATISVSSKALIFADHDTATSGTSFTDAEDGNMLVTDWTKNLLNPTLGTTTMNGVTCTANGDGTYTLNGTATNNVFFNINTNISINKGTKYKVVCFKDEDYVPNKILSCVRRVDTTDEYVFNNGSFVSDSENCWLWLEIAKDVTVSNLVAKPMITTDLSATYYDFVPYSGYEIKSCGKNLLKPTLQTTAENGITCTNNGDGTYTLNGSTSTTWTDFTLLTFSKSLSAKLIGCKLVGVSNFIDSNFGLRFSQFNSSFIVINEVWDRGNNNTILTYNENTYISNLYISIGPNITLDNILIKPMITTDLNATYDDFEPYTGETITVTNATEAPAFGLKSHKGITNIISPGNVKCVYPTNESGKGVLDAMYNNSQLSNELSKLKNAIIAMGGTV